MQIESMRAVENVEEILAVPGVGAIFIGPADLAQSLGVRSDHPDLEAAVQRVLAATQARNIPCGITANTQTAPVRLKQGFRLLTLGGDTGPSAGANAALEAARESVGRDD
jgi:4-hydroxy-2-oxoheptanedioate aldolase